jgi:hypothetical protein
MNRLAFDSRIGREADEYTARYDCSVSFRFRRSWHMFLEDCCLQVDTTSSLVQSGWVGLQSQGPASAMAFPFLPPC